MGRFEGCVRGEKRGHEYGIWKRLLAKRSIIEAHLASPAHEANLIELLGTVDAVFGVVADSLDG